MKKFCELLRELTLKIINFKRKKMTLLTKEQQVSYICKEKFKINI